MSAPESEFEADLSAYLDGELDEARAAEIASFLEHSPRARALLADLEQIRRGLRRLPRLAPPPHLAAAVQRALPETAPAEQARHRVFRLELVKLGRVAAAVLLTGAGLWYFSAQSGPRSSPAESDAVARNQDRGPRKESTELTAPIYAAAPGDPASKSFVDNTPAAAAPAAEPAPSLARQAREADAVVDAASLRSESRTEQPPVVEVVVVARDEIEYATAQRALRSQPAAAEAANPDELEIEICSADLALLIDALEQAAPQRVHVDLAFRGSDMATIQRILGDVQRVPARDERVAGRGGSGARVAPGSAYLPASRPLLKDAEIASAEDSADDRTDEPAPDALSELLVILGRELLITDESDALGQRLRAARSQPRPIVSERRPAVSGTDVAGRVSEPDAPWPVGGARAATRPTGPDISLIVRLRIVPPEP